jgi:hypothetical protein
MAVADAGTYAGAVDLTVDADVTVGALPPGTRDVIVAVGVVVRGRGLVLLGGKGASAIDDEDAGLGVEVPGTVRVPFAPPQLGLEGRAPVAVVVAMEAERFGATDRLGRVRTVVPLAMPSPSPSLVTALVPALDRPPSARVEGTSFTARSGAPACLALLKASTSMRCAPLLIRVCTRKVLAPSLESWATTKRCSMECTGSSRLPGQGSGPRWTDNTPCAASTCVVLSHCAKARYERTRPVPP